MTTFVLPWTASFEKESFNAEMAASGAEALEIINSQVIDLTFLDIGLPDGDGIELISRIKEIAPDIGIVMLTGINDAKTAVDSLKAGALDYIVKPFDIIEFKNVLHQLMQSLMMKKLALIQKKEDTPVAVIGSCDAMRQVKTSISTAAGVDSPVLITGETGTGKEVVARAIHTSQNRKNSIFVKVDCGTLSANLIESELFGYDKGAFTDARNDKKGLVQVASGGTLFLDEIGNLPLDLQPKLLRLIEESTFRKVGGLKDIKVKVRIIAATNSNLKTEIDAGSFREDLYYRLNVIPIILPPLRDREKDILLLADYFLHRLKLEMRKEVHGFTDAAQKALCIHDWPGNIRELRNMIEREIIFSKDAWLSLPHLCRQNNGKNQETDIELMSLKEMEHRYILKVLEQTGNNKSRAAKILDISRTTLRGKLA